MRFGIILPNYLPQASADSLRRVAILAEELSYDSVWTTDHVMLPKGTPAPYESVYEALSVLTWLAGVTHRVKLGVSVLVMTQRNAVLVAKEVATMDALSEGRIILGLGAGWSTDEFGFLNADFHHRGAVLDEGIGVLRSLWSTPGAPYHGRFFNLEGQAFAPPPVQAGGPPIWIGGMSPAALRRAATLGDAWHGNRRSDDELRAAIAAIRAMQGDREVEITLRGGPLPPNAASMSEAELIDYFRRELRTVADLGCSYYLLSFWQGDIDRQVALMKLAARHLTPEFATAA